MSREGGRGGGQAQPVHSDGSHDTHLVSWVFPSPAMRFRNVDVVNPAWTLGGRGIGEENPRHLNSVVVTLSKRKGSARPTLHKELGEVSPGEGNPTPYEFHAKRIPEIAARSSTRPHLPHATACGRRRSCRRSLVERCRSATSPWSTCRGPGSWR